MEENKLKINKYITWLILTLSFVGFLDALYLFIKRMFSSPINCLIFEGCETVNNSPYAQIFGIPLSFFGIVFYLAIFLIAIRYLQSGNSGLIKIIFYISVAGLLFAIYSLALQIFVIDALCVYCIVSVIASVLIFIVSCIAYGRRSG